MAFSAARCVRPQELMATAIDYVALEGRDGVAVADLMDAIEPLRDARLRRQVWQLLRRQHTRGVLQYFHLVSPPALPTSSGSSKKRKRPTGEHASNSTRRAARACAATSGTSDDKPDATASEQRETGAEDVDMDSTDGVDDRPITAITTHATAAEATIDEEVVIKSDGDAETTTRTDEPMTTIPHSTVRREPVVDAGAIAYEDACPVTCTAMHATPSVPRRKRLFVVACEELRLRALNIPRKAILAEFGDDHLRILEAVGRTRSMGMTIPALCTVFGTGSSVKKVHNSLDTLISYNLVVKRMMIVAKPTMRRLNIVHLPRFAANFVPEMYDESADFESDEQCKKILVSAAETYLKELPTHSAVLYDLGRDLGFQKRHLEVLKSHIMQECKREEHFHLELFQAILQPPKKGTAIEPKILNCVRYRAPSKDKSKLAQNQGMVVETGLLHQIYGAIEENGDSGTTIIDLRNRMVLPGNKLPYKLVSILAGTYGLRAEAIILGKNKAFKLYPMLSDSKRAAAAATQAKIQDDEPDDEDEITVIQSASNATLLKMDGARYKRVIGDTEQREELFSVRSNLALKVALGGIEVEGTRTRRRDHILARLEDEKIISLSSIRASMFLMEKKHASTDASTADGTPSTSTSHVGMVDTRSVSRIAAELEDEGALRLLQLPLPPRNVSTKFRALRCVVLPGYEDDEQFIQDYVKNYGRDERLRRIHQNVDKNEVVRLRAIDSDDEDVPGFTLYRRARKRQRAEDDEITPMPVIPRPVAPVSEEPTEISYRVRSFVSQEKTRIHSHQYRRLGFAYGVMFRCKQFHQFLWRFLHEHPELHLRDEEIDISVDEDDDFQPDLSANAAENGTRVNDDKRTKGLSRGIVFSRETILHRMPVYLYIQAFSGGSVLNGTEFALVDHAVKNGLGFGGLPQSVCAKVWAHESGRTSKVLGTLTDLKLIVPHKIGMKNLIKILRAGYTDDRDSILAQALKDNALGGLFRLCGSIRIILDDRQTLGRQPQGDQHNVAQDGVNAQSAVKLVGTTERKFSFGSLLPLKHTLTTAADVELYWEALEGLCVERMVMEVKSPKPNEPAVCQVPLPMKSRARRMLRVLGWISRSQKPTPRADDEAKTVKRTGIVSRAIRASRARRGPIVKKKLKKSARQTPNGTRNDTLANGDADRQIRKRASSTDANRDEYEYDEDESELFQWSEDDERQLVDYFIENCRSRWRIPIPQGLQRDTESVAFRVPWLSRSGFGLVSIARKLGKRKIDVKKRLREKLAEPDAKLSLEAAKQEMTQALNPSGVFDEEASIFESPRLTALFRRAVMMIVSPQDEYHPIVAEELISFWDAEEIRLVWRYLWLKNWIVRATERERMRGYSTSQRLEDFLKFSTLSYPLALFQQAAEQEAMVASTIDEVIGTNGVMSRTANQFDTGFEAEFPPNATAGQCALELGCQVMGVCSLVAVHSPIVDDSDGDLTESPSKVDEEKTAAMLRKRTLRFLNYKSQKEGTGFAAHLSKRLSFKNPAILTENWVVETKMSAVSVDEGTLQRKKFEAFSTVDEHGVACRPKKKAKGTRRKLMDAVEQVVRVAGERGAAFDDMMAHLESQYADVDASSVRLCVDDLVDAGVLICVNAYFAQRYVAKDHGDFWLLRSYSLVHEESTSLAKVVFEGEKDLLSFPWLKMDGSTNFRFLYSIQRKLLSCILLSPGVTEETVCRRMDKLLTLQDTREALALLAEDGLVYCRATGPSMYSTSVLPHTRKPTLFSKQQRRLAPSIDLITVASSRLLSVDRAKHVVHYFPHVECIQRFGSIVQDYQHDITDGPRG